MYHYLPGWTPRLHGPIERPASLIVVSYTDCSNPVKRGECSLSVVSELHLENDAMNVVFGGYRFSSRARTPLVETELGAEGLEASTC